MPLSKARMRERKRLDRLNVKPKSNLTTVGVVKPKLKAAGLIMQGNRIVSVKKQVARAKLPIYNPAIHKSGDKVLIRQGNRLVPYIVPDLDAGGQAITKYW